ncbi:MAG: fructosamine kinase family protein [Cyanobacteria bacterium P01_A01_bin.45]
MWTEIDARISQTTGEKYQTKQRRSVSGGSINQSYSVSDGERTYFMKFNQSSKVAMFEAEMLGLQQMYDTQTIRVPKPITCGVVDRYSYIVLEWVKMGKGDNEAWMQMGRNLAKMHRIMPPHSKGFGWDINNTIGSIPQINTWTEKWVDFFAKHRLGYQFQIAKRRGGHFPQVNELLAAVPRILSSHQPKPCLVHGDLWGGNAGFTTDNEPVIFDPATYYGDREVDIAMTELFGGYPTAFYRGYNEVYSLDRGYEKRKILYNLYHVINHFNLFGSGYVGQANSMISRILG